MNINYISKCLFIEVESKKIIVVGDLHLGYEEVLNKMGVFVSRQMYNDMVLDFEKIFEKTGNVDFVILLGDVKHEFSGNLRQEWNDVLNLFDYFDEKLNKDGKIIITKGNHDNYLKTIASKRKDILVEDFFILNGFAFIHGDKNYEVLKNKEINCWIMGHIHPAIKLSDGLKIEKYKCFLEGNYKKKKIIVVPSFIEFRQGSDVREDIVSIPWDFKWKTFNVKIIGENLDVFDFGILGEIE